MQEYLEVFRVEAKSLLKNFQNNDEKAIARCKAVFGDKKDLSLMNMQHVIAKEYGFNDWNELAYSEDWQLAEALVKTKSKEFVSPLVQWRGQHIVTSYKKSNLHKPDFLGIDMKNFTRNGRPWLTFEHLDVSEYDLSKLNVSHVRYGEDTKWPDDESKMPKGFKPQEFLEYRKNPGLGIRQLHKQGIDGRGRNVAIIHDFRLCDHLEYHNQLKSYEELHIDENSGRIGFLSELTSALVGKTCGVAPKANVYYYAVDGTDRKKVYYAEAIKKVCELHKKLISEGKTGIDVILTRSGLFFEGYISDNGYIEALQAAIEATKLGIWCYSAPARFVEHPEWREEAVYCKIGGDVDNPDDYVIKEDSWRCEAVKCEKDEFFRNSLNFPGGGKTVAQNVSMGDYVFDHCGGGYTIAYAVGLYLLAKGVKPDLTAEEYWRLGIETGDFRKGIGTIINPRRLIDALRK